MKKIIYTSLAAIIMAFTASAEPSLFVEGTITKYDRKGVPHVLTMPRIIVESGKQASVRTGNLEYKFTPTLNNDGTIGLRTIMIKHNGKKAGQLTAPYIIAKPGKVATMRTGQLVLSVKTLLKPQKGRTR